MRLTSQQIVTGLRGSLELHVTHGDRMMIPFHSPRDIHHAPVRTTNHEPRGVGIGCCGTLAAAARISKIAATPQRVYFDDHRPVRRAMTAIKVAQRRGGRYQLSQRRSRNEKRAGHGL